MVKRAPQLTARCDRLALAPAAFFPAIPGRKPTHSQNQQEQSKAVVDQPPILLANQLTIVEIQGHGPPIDHASPALFAVGQFECKKLPAFIFLRVEGTAIAKAIFIHGQDSTGQRIVGNILDGAL